MTKESRVFEALMRGGNYNRFEAAKLLHHNWLNSTVATLERKYRITINSVFETVRGFMGNSIRDCRYWIGQRKQAVKEPDNATDQDKESGSQSNAINLTDEYGASQTCSELDE
jgi:hypothetical protein